MDDTVQPLVDVLLARDPLTGERRYSVVEGEDCLAALLLAEGVPDASTLSPALGALVEGLLARAGASASDERSVIDDRLSAYFAMNPLPEAFVRAVAARERHALAETDLGELEAASARLGAPVVRRKEPPADGPKGALAYFAAHGRD